MYLIAENNAFAEEVIGKICEGLGREHRTAMAANEPAAARAILNAAHAFANELAGANAEDAAAILGRRPEIAEYEVHYHPAWLPKQMPNCGVPRCCASFTSAASAATFTATSGQ